MDRSATATLPSAAPAPPRSGVEFSLEGMTCAACAARIDKVLNRVPGVHATVNFATETATAQYDPAQAGPAQMIAAVERAGYRAIVRSDPERDRDVQKARKTAAYAALKRELLVAFALTLPLLAQMVPMLARGDLFGAMPHGEWLPGGCSSCSQRRCSSGSGAASMSAPGTRCAAAAPTWMC